MAESVGIHFNHLINGIMKMIHNYEDFCKYYDQGRVKPDLSSPLGWKSAQALMKMGWDIDSKNLFGITRISKISQKLLAICRESEDNFQTAYQHAGIDF